MIGTADADAIALDQQLLWEDADAAVHAMRILLAVVGGTQQLPDRQRTEALFKRLHETDRGRFSLTRTVIAKRRGEVLLTREQRGKGIDAGEVNRPTMRSPWDRLLPYFDLEPARAVDQLLGKTPPPALPWP